ncbi:LLM class flavin-dependent oxidoreductase [Chitinophaga sp.]|uniref:LLM class flavin-dependent oxidoreductase n=1 Tax=Chitinophaga sp. TaxID=1869181 RepID=UPI0031CFC1DB
MKIGLLDFGAGKWEVSWMLENTINYAVKADELGFSRFWLGEHYTPNHFWCSPETMIPIIAGMTSNIKVGAAGILLSIHSPYRVALTFKLLGTLFPGRIDLGLANGSPSTHVAQLMLGMEDVNGYKDKFHEKTNQLLRFLRNEKENWAENTLVPPYGGGIPDIWGLGRSYNGLRNALEQKTHFSRSLFHDGADRTYHKEALQEFRENYYTTHGEYPQINLSFAGVCAKTSQGAKRILEKLGPDELQQLQSVIYGCPNKVYDELHEMQENFGVDEFIMQNLIYENRAKMKSIELIGEKFSLSNKRTYASSVSL